MKKVFVDPSLARGLAKDAVRSAVDRDEELLRQVKADKRTGVRPKGRAAAFRHGVDLVRRRSGTAIAFEKQIGTGIGKKSDQHIIAIWDAVDTERNLALGMMWLRARDFTAVDYAPLLVSRHACERIFQRLGSTDRSQLEAELRSATMLAVRLWTRMTRADVSEALSQESGVMVPTRSGALFVKRDSTKLYKPHLLATTWVSADQLKPDQIRQLDDISRGILEWRDATSGLVTKLAIPVENWDEITAQIEIYGRTQSMRY